MSFKRIMVGAAALTLALAGPLVAQERSVSLFARGGGFNALTDLDDAGEADFRKAGYDLGAGVAVDLSRYFALRGDFTFARNELRLDGVDSGNDLNRFFYDAAVQVQVPTALGLMPYAYVGGGGVTLHQVGTDGEDSTKGVGTFGLGLNYTAPGSGLGFFLEGKSWLFDASELQGALATYDKAQYEIAWTGGFSYRLPY